MTVLEGVNVDALVQEAYAPQGETPMETPAQTETTEQSNEQVTEPTEEMFTLNWNGEAKEFPRTKVVQYAQQGYDYNEKMRQLKVDRELYESDRKRFEDEREGFSPTLERYKAIDELAINNPDWFAFVQAEYDKALKNGGVPQADPKIEALSKTVESLKGALDKQEEQNQARQRAELDDALGAEITKYKKENEFFDWGKPDNDGLTLEQRVLNYAVDNQLPSFRIAANELLRDQFIDRAKLQARENVGKQIQEKTRKGIAGITNKKGETITKPTDLSRSYDELAAEGLREIAGG